MAGSKESKIMWMIGLATFFFFLELVSGYLTGSIALVADSFHMLSDVVSLFIALIASKLAKSKDVGPQYSYGLQRAEVLGALINAVSLLALSFSLVIQAIERLLQPEHIDKPWVVLYVACAGLVVNILGIFLFHDHSHMHGHDHHHADEYTRLTGTDEVEELRQDPVHLGAAVVRAASLMQEQESKLVLNVHADPESGSHSHSHSDEHGHHEHDHHHHHGHSHVDMNMHGVFLHVLGDLLASIGIICSTLAIIFLKGDWTIYVDPLMSLMITGIIIASTIPLCKSASFILLQATPKTVSVELLKQDLLTLPGVIGIHELHVWQLSDKQTIASVHVRVPMPAQSVDNHAPEANYMALATAIKERLHSHGIHSTTIQPEYVTEDYESSEQSAVIAC